MAGHSHWAGIKHKKAINDAKKGKAFSRLAKLVYTAVREGGSGKPEDNPRLRLIIDKCRQANMPKDNIKRAIDKALDSSQGYDAMSIEGYGAGGVAIIAECLTDKTNRTGPEVRRIFEKAGAKVGTPGCVSYLFHRKGVFHVEKNRAGEEMLMEIALDAGAEDIVDQGDFFELYCEPGDFVKLGEVLEQAGIETSKSELQLVPDNLVGVNEEDARRVMQLTEMLEDHEDVANVFSNIDVSAEIAEALSRATD